MALHAVLPKDLAHSQRPEHSNVAPGGQIRRQACDALLKLDVGALYAMGVHGLLLRPFTILHKVAEPDYLKAIRGE